MAVKENDWFAINLLNEDVNALDLVSNDINSSNTALQSREYYKSLKDVQEVFKNKDTGKFDEKAFNKAYDSALYTYNRMATTDYEKELLNNMEQDPDYWLDPGAKIRSTSATISLSDDPYHRGSGLSGLWSVSDPNWSVREIAQSQEVEDENGNSLGWTPNDHALLGGSLKGIWQPTLALASWDEDGYHTDADGNKIRHRKGEYKLNKNGEFYYEKLGDRSAIGKELLRFSDTITVDGTWVNKLDVFDADSVDKSVGGTIVRTALEMAPILIPGVNKIWGIVGAVYHTAEVMPTLAKVLNNFFGSGEESELGGKINRAANWFKRFDATQSDTAREKFMSFEQIGNQIADIGNQLYQQKFVGQLGYLLSSGGKQFQGGSKLGKAFSTTYMAATSGMDSYEIAKEAGANDTWAGIYTLAVMAGFYALMSSDYYKDVLFGENSLLNEEFVTVNTVKGVGKELEAALKGVPANITPVEARGWFQRAFEATKRNGGKWLKKVKQGFAKGETGEALATAETAERAAISAAETAATRLTAAEVEGKAVEAVKNGILGKSSNGTSWFNIMLNRASNESIEEMMEEAMQDTGKALLNGAEALGFKVKEKKSEDLDFGFSFEDFISRYLTAGIGGFVGGSLFAGLDKWEKIWSPNMRDITSRGINNGERIAYILKEGGRQNLMDHIDKLERKGIFGSKNLSFKGTPYTTMDGNTTWNFEHTDNESESQNATIANALRAYIDYIGNTMRAYDFMKTDVELSKILRNSDAENKEAVEVLKRESPFTYSQLEKAMNKENKRREKAGDSERVTIQDMYEHYNYADTVIRAMDKCGFFQDFYHDYLMLGTKLIGLNYNLDCKAQDYKLTHPHDNSGWNDDPEKKRLEEKIKDIEKQRDAIMNGEKNTDYIQRAIYMAYDPVNTVFTENEGEITPLAERSVYDYAMSRYGLDLHDPDVTSEEKDQLNKEFDDYKKLKNLEKVKASYDVFINLANTFNPEIKGYMETEAVKTANLFFGTNVNKEEIQKKLTALRERLANLQQQIRNFTPDTIIIDSWGEDEKKYADIFQNLGIGLGSITWVDSNDPRLNGAEGFYDPGTNTFVFAKGKDPEKTKQTIFHEVIGHYGLRQLLDGPMKDIFRKKLSEYQKDHEDIRWTLGTGAEFGSNVEQLMEVLYQLADDTVKNKIKELRKLYNYKEENFNAVWDNWLSEEPLDPKNKATKDMLEMLQRNGLASPGEGATDVNKADAKEAFDRATIRVLTEEYLAELAALQINQDELSKEDQSWLYKVIDFFKKIFGLDPKGDTKLNEDFYIGLMRLSKDNLMNTAKRDLIINFIKPQLQRDPKLVQIDKLNPNNFTREQIEAEITKEYVLWKEDGFIDTYAETLKGEETEYPTFKFNRLGNIEKRKWIKINNFSELIELLTFGTTNKTAESNSLFKKELNCPFIGFGFKGKEFENGLRVIGVNSENLTPELLTELANKIHNLDPKIKVIPYSDLDSFEDTETHINEDRSTVEETFTQFKSRFASKYGYSTLLDLTEEELLQIWTGELEYKDGILGRWKILNIPNFITTPDPEESPAGFLNQQHIFFATKITPNAASVTPKNITLSESIIITDFLDDTVRQQVEAGNLNFVGDFNGKQIFIGNSLIDVFMNNEDINIATMSSEESDLRLQESELQKEINDLDRLNYASRQTENEEGKRITMAINIVIENILTPNVSVDDQMNDFINALQSYATYCKEHNVADPNLEYVYQQINDVKNALKARIKSDILSQLEELTGQNKMFIEKVFNQVGEGYDYTIDDLIKTIVDTDFENDVSTKNDTWQNLDMIIQQCLLTFNVSDAEIDFALKPKEDATTTIYGEKIQEILNTFVPNSEALAKFYELMNFDRLGETIKLSNWIKLMLKGTEPNSQMKLQDYVMENADAKNLIENIRITHRILKALVDSGRSDFGRMGLFAMFNIYAPDADFYTYIGDTIPEILTRELTTLENKLNFLGEITGLSTERQIKVQKEIAKETYYKLIHGVLGLGKIFNVDIPELWNNAGGTNIDNLSTNMNDSEFAKFFETIKKFEHLFNEAIYNSDDFKSKNNEEKINTLLELINDKKLYTGTIADGKVNLSEYTIGAYILSLIVVDSDNFYSKLKTVSSEISDLKIPFPAQLFAIKLGDAYAKDSDNLFTEYSKHFDSGTGTFIENVIGIFGSAGTGKTTVIANIIAQLNKDKNIFYSTNGEAQLKKLINSINNATEEKGFIIQNLIDEIAPDWDTNFKVEKTNLIYTGTVKFSPTYDSKLKNGILIIDEATKLDTKKWQALAQYAKINNIKIFALGDLKQTGEFKRVESEGITSLFTDLKMCSTPILTESIRPANQAQRNNLVLFGKNLDNAINILQETGSITNAIPYFIDNPITLKYKDVNGALIGTKLTSDKDAFKSKIREVESNLKDEETIAIITDSNDYDTLASDKIQIIPVREAQGNEWTYVFADFSFNEDKYIDLQELYTIISRAQQGSLIISNEKFWKDLGITFAEDTEGDLKISANKGQFTNYNNWMKQILFNFAPVSTETPTETTTPEESSEEVSPEARRRFISEFRNSFLENPDIYVKNIDSEIVANVLSNSVETSIIKFNNKPIAEFNGAQYVVLQVNPGNNILFVKHTNFDGTIVFKPVKQDATGNLTIDVELLKSSLIQTLGNYLVNKFDVKGLDSIEKITDSTLLTQNLLTGQNAEDAFEDFIITNSLETFSDAENLLQQGSYTGDENAQETLEKAKKKLNRAKSKSNNINDNFYVKKLLENNFGNKELNDLFLKGVSNENKRKAIKIIADLVKLDAHKTSKIATHVSEIDLQREAYIRKQLGYVFDSRTVDAILDEVFKEEKVFRVKDTSVQFDKELYLVVGDVEIYIGEIRNASWADGYYKNNGKFNVEFYRTAISTAGRKRTNVEDLFKEGMFNYADPAVVVGDAKINTWFATLIDEAKKHPENIMLQNFVTWMKRNNGKVMQAYTNISYLDMSNPTNIYQAQMHSGKNGNFPYAYNDMYGDLMGVQRVVSLEQLYTYSILAKYAQTGDPNYGAMANVAFPDVTSQSEAIKKLEKILGSSAEMQVIPENSLNVRRKEIAWNNTRKFNTSGLLLNRKNTEKIETLMTIAALESGSTNFQQFLMAFQLFAQNASRKNRNHGGFSFKIYDNTEMKGEPRAEFVLTVSRAGRNAVWTLKEVKDGKAKQDKNQPTWESAVITPDIFNNIIVQIMSNVGESGLTVLDFLKEGHLSIQPCIDWYFAEKDGTSRSGISTMNISDFFVTLLSNPNLEKISNLFPACETLFDTMNNKKGLFRSGIYLETRSTGANYVSQNGNSQDSFWKKDIVQNSDTPYSTDILRIYNPIRSLELLPTTKPGTIQTYKVREDLEMWGKLAPADTGTAESIVANSKEEFLAKFNAKLKSEAGNIAIKYRQYSEDGGREIWNESRIKDLGNIVEDLDTRIILEKDGNWDVYDINLNRVVSFTNENVQTIKQAQEMFSDFKNIFRDVLRGNKKIVDLIGIPGVAKMEGWKQLFKALKPIC